MIFFWYIIVTKKKSQQMNFCGWLAGVTGVVCSKNGFYVPDIPSGTICESLHVFIRDYWSKNLFLIFFFGKLAINDAVLSDLFTTDFRNFFLGMGLQKVRCAMYVYIAYPHESHCHLHSKKNHARSDRLTMGRRAKAGLTSYAPEIFLIPTPHYLCVFETF